MDDATFEKMGALMQESGSRLLGFFDELSAFLTQINLYKGRNLSDSHELALFLQLFNGHPWKRDTGKVTYNVYIVQFNLISSYGELLYPAFAKKWEGLVNHIV